MFKGLNKINLPGRLDGAGPKIVTRVVVTIALLVVVAVARRAIMAVAPGVVPFPLAIPRGPAGDLAGRLDVGRSDRDHRRRAMPGSSPCTNLAADRPSADAVNLALYVICAGSIVAFAELFRARARMLVRGQAALQASEARLELATKAAAVGVWEWRLTTNEMIYSPEARAICGFPADGPVTYEMVAAVTHPDDFPHTSAQAARALDPQIRDESPYEYRLKLADGQVRWVTANGRAVFETVDGVTVATRYVGTLQDITARKRAEIERDEGAQRLGLAIDAGRMAVWQVDQRGISSLSPELNRDHGEELRRRTPGRRWRRSTPSTCPASRTVCGARRRML